MANHATGSKTTHKRKAATHTGVPIKRKRNVVENFATKGLKNEVNFQTEIMDKLDEELKCNICTELLIKPAVLNCSHMFCEYCILKWKKQQERCPICRERIESQTRVAALDVFIEKAIGILSPEQSRAREEVVKQREKTKSQRPRRSARLRNRAYVTVTTAQEALEDTSFHLRALIDEVLHLANHFTYD